MSSELDCQRDHFDIPTDVAYLNAAYMGPLSREVVKAGQAGLERKARPWTITQPDFFEPVDRLKALFAQLIGGDADGVSVVGSVSYGLALAAANVNVPHESNVVLLAEQFPSNVYVWHDLAQRAGAQVRVVGRPPGEDWTPAVLEAIDDQTAVVAIPQCHWTDGTLVDLERVGGRARQNGAALVVDGIQSIGAMDIDVNRIQPDFLTASCYKWLLGPYSLGFVWSAPHRRQGRPIEHNWITHEGSSDFAHLVDYRWELREGGARYDMGEVSNFALVPAATAALEQVLGWGVEAISAYAGKLNARIAEGARSLGLGITPPDLRAPHILGIRLSGSDPEVVAAALREANVHVSVRGTAVRVAPHVYNDEDDADRLIRALERSLRS